jgi:hypothetical protein
MLCVFSRQAAARISATGRQKNHASKLRERRAAKIVLRLAQPRGLLFSGGS